MPLPREPRTLAASRKDRWLSACEKRDETRFFQFRPYHAPGKRRFGAYATRHCRQSVAAFEKIEAFFHAKKMRAAGYLLDSNNGRWIYFGPRTVAEAA